MAAGGEVTVKLKAPPGQPFRGFILQARTVDGDLMTGTFRIVTEYQYDMRYLKCKAQQSSVTHRNSAPKTSISVSWRPAKDFSGDVKIFATVVQDYSNYWVNLPSETLSVTV